MPPSVIRPTMVKGTKRKIEIKKCEAKEQRSVAFSKRRQTLFAKAADLCLLSGANITVLVTFPAENSDVVYSFSGYSSASEIAYCYLNGGKLPPPKVNPQSKLGFGWEDPNLYNSCDEVGESSGSSSQFISDQNPNSWSPSPAQFASSDQTQTETQVRKETKPSCSSALYKRREATLVKKAYELSTLCGIDVCIICYDRDGELIKTWPEDRAKVRDMAERFSRLSDKEKKKKSTDLSRFLNKKASSENNKKVSEASLESRVGMFKEEKLVEDQTNVVSTMINVGGYEDQSFWDNLYNEDAFGLDHGFFLDNNNFQANTTTDDYMIDGTFTQLPNSAPPSFEQPSIPHYN